MKLSFKQIKKAAIMVYAIMLLFFIGCKNTGQSKTPPDNNDILYQTTEPDISDSVKWDDMLYNENIPANEDSLTNENMLNKEEVRSTEPLVHSIKSTIDIDNVKSVSILGEFRTYYGDSSESRAANIENAAKKIDGTVLKPSEVFSCKDTIAPFTKKNGYKPAGTYENGKVVESIGGGICQISTTLYNAVLKAELKIVERAAHSMMVSYVDVSMDAAIAGDYKDLKFKNSLKDPVTIHATTEDGWLIIEIEGTETRSTEREIKFETVILSKTKPGEDVITIDESREDDYYKVTQTAHTGYQAELYKIVYENGKLTDKVQINKSSYEASPKYVTVGKK